MKTAAAHGLHHDTTIPWVRYQGMVPYSLHSPLHTSAGGLYTYTINLAVPSSIQFPHSHNEKSVLLYYINPEWKNEYYGETLFYDDYSDEIIQSSKFVPGRFILFDGKTPHSIRPSSHIAPQYRFTLFVGFDEKNFIEAAKNNS